MDEVKYLHITNETVRKELFNIPNIERHIATRHPTFIGKVARNSDNHIPTKLLTAWYDHKRQRGSVLHTNNKPLFTNYASSYQEWEKLEH